MIYIRRHMATILIAFTTWTVGVSVATYRERAIANKAITDYAVKAECAYHEGSDEGYRNGLAEGRRDRARLMVRDNSDGSQEITIEEDDPAWDCHTMGNRVCGASDTGVDTKDHTTQRVTKTARK